MEGLVSQKEDASFRRDKTAAVPWVGVCPELDVPRKPRYMRQRGCQVLQDEGLCTRCRREGGREVKVPNPVEKRHERPPRAFTFMVHVDRLSALAAGSGEALLCGVGTPDSDKGTVLQLSLRDPDTPVRLGFSWPPIADPKQVLPLGIVIGSEFACFLLWNLSGWFCGVAAEGLGLSGVDSIQHNSGSIHSPLCNIYPKRIRPKATAVMNVHTLDSNQTFWSSWSLAQSQEG
ncbi:hypothetical protein CB1_000803002 [Camelus ferus]|nr:hypothetical protein CB1_000803002 [Camelus ferus]